MKILVNARKKRPLEAFSLDTLRPYPRRQWCRYLSTRLAGHLKYAMRLESCSELIRRLHAHLPRYCVVRRQMDSSKIHEHVRERDFHDLQRESVREEASPRSIRIHIM